MCESEILQQEITQWIQTSLENEDIKDFETVVTGTTEKGDGYLGDVFFIKVNGLKKSCNEKTEVNLVMKLGKRNETTREKLSVREVCSQELFVYGNVFPEYRRFQESKGVKTFDAVPKCYNTILLENTEVLVIENLKTRGFELHDKQVPLNSSHIKLILSNYAKFHAVSFAMRDQNKHTFEALVANYGCVPKLLMVTEEIKTFNEIKDSQAKKLIEKNDEGLAKLYCKVFEKGLSNILEDILDDDVEESVITHGDCWNNNFMFKYEDNETKTPSEVAILDWQLSCLHSPVLDLSYFLYIVSAEDEVAQFDEFLQFYHEKLSENIIELGSDPENLYPFSSLMKHWQKYSAYGIIQLITALDILLCDKDTAMDFEDMGPESQLSDWTNVTLKNPEVYRNRLLATVRYYCNEYMKW